MKMKHFSNNFTSFSRALSDIRDFPDLLVRKEREDLVERLAVSDPVDLPESVYVMYLLCDFMPRVVDISLTYTYTYTYQC